MGEQNATSSNSLTFFEKRLVKSESEINKEIVRKRSPRISRYNFSKKLCENYEWAKQKAPESYLRHLISSTMRLHSNSISVWSGAVRFVCKSGLQAVWVSGSLQFFSGYAHPLIFFWYTSSKGILRLNALSGLLRPQCLTYSRGISLSDSLFSKLYPSSLCTSSDLFDSCAWVRWIWKPLWVARWAGHMNSWL